MMPQATITESSILGNRWEMRETDERLALAISQRLDVPEIVGRLLDGRDVSLDDADAFLNPALRDSLPDSSHFKDMDVAAGRVATAIVEKETIGIFGDYDVDGATSSALLVRYFRALDVISAVHIPDRKKEGYGPNLPAFMGLKEKGASIIITVDCGTVAFEPIAKARAAGLDIVVIDHHKGEGTLPQAVAVVNPNRMDESSPYTHLAAVGMTFLLLVAVNRKLRELKYFGPDTTEPDLRQWLDLVALGTVCDVVKLTGVNRAFVAQGLKVFAHRNNTGLCALSDVAGVNERPNAYHLGFLLGPRINAGGRVGQSALGTRLLSTDDIMEARELAAILDRHNAERQAIEAIVLEEAQLQADSVPTEYSMIQVHGENWHEGVIGIVAGRLKDTHNKPAIVISVCDGIGKGSARSVAGIDIGAAIVNAHAEGLLLAGGGHSMAAGFTVAVDKISALKDFISGYIIRTAPGLQRQKIITIDTGVSLGAVTAELAKTLERVGPFGMGNPQPRLMITDVRVIKSDIVGKGHVRVILAESGVFGRASSVRLKAIAFRASESPLGQLLLRSEPRPINLAGSIRLNEWQGNVSAELHISDAMYV